MKTHLVKRFRFRASAQIIRLDFGKIAVLKTINVPHHRHKMDILQRIVDHLQKGKQNVYLCVCKKAAVLSIIRWNSPFFQALRIGLPEIAGRRRAHQNHDIPERNPAQRACCSVIYLIVPVNKVFYDFRSSLRLVVGRIFPVRFSPPDDVELRFAVLLVFRIIGCAKMERLFLSVRNSAGMLRHDFAEHAVYGSKNGLTAAEISVQYHKLVCRRLPAVFFIF